MKLKGNLLLAVPVILALSVAVAANDVVNLAGVLLWNGKPLRDFTREVPALSIRTEHGYGDEIEGYEYTYDLDTSTFTIRGLELVDRSALRFETPGLIESSLGLGPFAASKPILLSYFNPEDEVRIDMKYGFALLGPGDAMQSIEDSPSVRPTIQTPVEFRWEPVPEATHYATCIYEFVAGRQRVVLKALLSGSWIDIDLPESSEGGWYILEVLAYNDDIVLGNLSFKNADFVSLRLSFLVTASPIEQED